MISRRGNRWTVKFWQPDPEAKSGRRMVWVGTFDTRDEARRADAQALLTQAHRPCGQREWTIEHFYDRWLVRYHGPGSRRPEPSTLEHNQAAMTIFVKAYGHRRLRDFQPSEARDFAAEFAWRAKVVAAFFADAVRDGKLYDTPFRGVGIAKAKGRRDIDPLTMGEVDRLAQIANDTLGFYGPHFAAFIRVAAWTGMRPGELCRMQWRDIDWDACELDVRQTKTKVDRTISLAPQAVSELQRLARIDNNVFHTAQGRPLRKGSYLYAWSQVRAVFEDEVQADHWLAVRLRRDPSDRLAVYELRHACGSMLAAQHCSAWEIAEHLGNSAKVCEQIYVHAYRSQVRARIRGVFEQIGENVVSSGEREAR